MTRKTKRFGRGAEALGFNYWPGNEMFSVFGGKSPFSPRKDVAWVLARLVPATFNPNSGVGLHLHAKHFGVSWGTPPIIRAASHEMEGSQTRVPKRTMLQETVIAIDFMD